MEKGIKPPTYHEVRVSYFKKAVEKVTESLGKYKNEWGKWGCTLMCDGWTDRNGRSLTNFLVNSPSRTVFLKSVDTSTVIKDANQMFNFLDSMVEEIGEHNVVQEVTDGSSNLVASRKLLKMQKNVTTYIYRHTWVISLYRQFCDGELARPAVTRFATAYLTLQYIDAKPVMPYIYKATDRTKEKIAASFNNEKSRYIKVWKLIDERWDLQLHRPLHAATYYLNPKYHYQNNFNPDNEVLYGFYVIIHKMTQDTKTRVLIDRQLENFKGARGIFWSEDGMLLVVKEIGKFFYQIHTKRRNWLEHQRLNAVVNVKYNLQLEMRQKTREEKGDNYNPICLSDIESDYEWITEKETSCLPNDDSWMDIHESFTLEEGAPSKKRKRGPRNLNARSNVGKGKSICEDESVVEEIIAIEEEGDEQLENEEDDLSDVDLEDD
ncbi:uncharacterized protein LOC130744151 [Lotus japonicus]|uniref:uncharacterized protein LOC130744151 n=1 Tax=Lotus japonicus TaxID=34305 RepID=UPI00258EC2E1|nr:uncharacterized protein LOC130744151 [Lotus japonicus]